MEIRFSDRPQQNLPHGHVWECECAWLGNVNEYIYIKKKKKRTRLGLAVRRATFTLTSPSQARIYAHGRAHTHTCVISARYLSADGARRGSLVCAVPGAAQRVDHPC